MSSISVPSLFKPSFRRKLPLDEVDRVNHGIEDALRSVPEAEDVSRRTARAERTEDPMPHTVSDALVLLKPDRKRSSEEIEKEMRRKLESVAGARSG